MKHRLFLLSAYALIFLPPSSLSFGSELSRQGSPRFEQIAQMTVPKGDQEIAISDGAVVVLSGSTTHWQDLNAFDRDNGKKLWSKEFRSNPNSSQPDIFNLYAFENILILGRVSKREAYDSRTGALLWSFDDNNGNGIVVGETLILTGAHQLYGVDPVTGAILWTKRFADAGVTSKPVFNDGSLYIESHSTYGGSTNIFRFSFDPRTPKIAPQLVQKFSQPTPTTRQYWTNTLSTLGKQLLVRYGTESGGLINRAVSSETGNVLWEKYFPSIWQSWWSDSQSFMYRIWDNELEAYRPDDSVLAWRTIGAPSLGIRNQEYNNFFFDPIKSRIVLVGSGILMVDSQSGQIISYSGEFQNEWSKQAAVRDATVVSILDSSTPYDLVFLARIVE